MEKCKHNFINVNDDSLDKVCVICGKRVKQGILYFEPKIEINIKDIIDEDEIAKGIAKELSKGVARNLVRGRSHDYRRSTKT